MSVYKPKGSEVYVYDFQWRGRRFSGSTGVKSKREAEPIERDAREKAKAATKAAEQRDGGPMTLDVACQRYWIEAGQHARNTKQVEWSIEYLLKHFGESKLIGDISESDVASLVAKRRGERVDNVMVRKHKTAKAGKRVSAATVNRSVVEPLRRIMLRARDVWGKEIGLVVWKNHKMAEPKERIRSLSDDEQARLFAVLPDAYKPIVLFALRTGCRAMECVNLRWSDIDWGNRRISIFGKGDKLAPVPLSIDMRDLLFPTHDLAHEFVFMLPAITHPSGKHMPRLRMTYRAFYSAFYTACKRAGITGLRIHDLRHTAATRLVQKTGNLKMAMKLLRHEDIGTTAKYAAVLDDDLRNAMDMMAAQEVPGKVPEIEAKSLKEKAL